MLAADKQKLALAIVVPALIFMICTLLTFSAAFQQHPDELTLGILIDMLFLAPFLYFIIIYKTAIAKTTVLRVFFAGAFLATVILSTSNLPVVIILRTYILPVAEVMLVSYVIYQFYVLRKHYKKSGSEGTDFLTQSRALLTSLVGSIRIANILAAEIAVLYYIFFRKQTIADDTTTFSSYKENGIRLILHTFLALLLIETVGVHFVLQLWDRTAAWIVTGLSIYSCLQLYAHIRSLQARLILISGQELHLRNGILGGDVVLQLQNIDQVTLTGKRPSGSGVVNLALIKELEKHNLAIFLKEPVTVIKAFGLKRSGRILLVSVDNPEAFRKSLTGHLAASN